MKIIMYGKLLAKSEDPELEEKLALLRKHIKLNQDYQVLARIENDVTYMAPLKSDDAKNIQIEVSYLAKQGDSTVTSTRYVPVRKFQKSRKHWAPPILSETKSDLEITINEEEKFIFTGLNPTLC